MRRYVAGLLLVCLLLLQPTRSKCQRPLDEGQQKLIGMSSQQQKQLEEAFSKARAMPSMRRGHASCAIRSLHSNGRCWPFTLRMRKRYGAF